MFKERLRVYREEMNLKKKEMADHLNISESYYNLIENGKREPSKAFIVKLVNLSEKPEEYWLYGIKEENYIKERDDLKSIYQTLKLAIQRDLIDDVSKILNPNCPEFETLNNLITAAIRSDLSYMLEKKNATKKEG